MTPEKLTYCAYVHRCRLDAARGCVNGLIVSLIAWLVLALIGYGLLRMVLP